MRLATSGWTRKIRNAEANVVATNSATPAGTAARARLAADRGVGDRESARDPGALHRAAMMPVGCPPGKRGAQSAVRRGDPRGVS
jgi:hypothetical protein